jgi:hypothetical protein
MNSLLPRNDSSHLRWTMLFRIISLLLLAFILAASPALAAEKMKPEALVAKHLDSIAPAEARAQMSGRVIGGTVRANFRIGGSGQVDGLATLTFQGPQAMFALLFQALEYPHEKFAFNGTKLEVAQLKPGVRSPLCQFLYVQDEVFHAGIFGGALSTGWALLDPALRGAKLEYAGLRKIDNRPVHEVRIRPKKNTDLLISLFFEDETFHHIRTQYRLRIPAPMGARPDDSASQRETRHQLIEDFADFKPEGQWTLPHQYQIQLTIEGQGPTVMSDWQLNLSKFDLNAKLTAADFNIQN